MPSVVYPAKRPFNMGQEQSSLNDQALKSTSGISNHGRSAVPHDQRGSREASPKITNPLKRPASVLEDERRDDSLALAYIRNRESTASNRHISQVTSSSNMRHSFVRDAQESRSPDVERDRITPHSPSSTVPVNETERGPPDLRPASSRAGSASRAFDWSIVPAGPKRNGTPISQSHPLEPDSRIQAARSQPHVFITKQSLPLDADYTRHLWNYLRRHVAPGYDVPREIFMGTLGWYLVFGDSRKGRAFVARCVEEMDGQNMFGKHDLVLQPFPYGLQGTTPIQSTVNRPRRVSVPGSPAYAPPRISTPSSEPRSPRSSPAPATLQAGTGNATTSSHVHSPLAPQDPASMSLLRSSIRSDFDEAASTISSTARSDASRSKQPRCHICRRGAAPGVPKLTQCSTCTRRYHRHCHASPPINPSLPEKHSWRCSRCVGKNITGHSELPKETLARLSASSPLTSRSADSSEPPTKKARLDPAEQERSVRNQPPAVPHVNDASVQIPQNHNASTAGRQTGRAVADGPQPLNVPIRADQLPGFEDADALVDKSFGADSTSTKSAGPSKSGKLKITRTKVQTHRAVGPEHSSQAQNGNASGKHAGQANADPSYATGRSSNVPNQQNARKPQSENVSRQVGAQRIGGTSAAGLRALALQRTRAKIQKELTDQGRISVSEDGTASAANVEGQHRTATSLESGMATVGDEPSTKQLVGASSNESPVTQAHNQPRNPAAAVANTAPTNHTPNGSARAIPESPTETRKEAAGSGTEPGVNVNASTAQEALGKDGEARAAAPSISSARLDQNVVNFQPKIRPGPKRDTTKLIPCIKCNKNLVMRDPRGMNKLCLKCKKAVAAEREALESNPSTSGQPPKPSDKTAASSDRVQQAAPLQSTRDTEDKSHDNGAFTHPISNSSSAEQQDVNTTESSSTTSHTPAASKPTSIKVSGPQRRSCDHCHAHHHKCTHYVKHIPSSSPSTPAETSLDEIGSAPAAVEPAEKATHPKSKTTPHREDVPSASVTQDPSQPSTNKLEKLRAALGNSFSRPHGGHQKLVGMAFTSALGKRLQCRTIVEWIADNIPGFATGEGNWEACIGSHLSAWRSTEEKAGYWAQTKWQEGDGGNGRRSWYELMPGVVETLWQWDVVLKEPSSPQQSRPTPTAKIISKSSKPELMVRLKTTLLKDGQSASATPDDTASRKTERKTTSSIETSLPASLEKSGTELRIEPEVQHLVEAAAVEDEMDVDVTSDTLIHDEADAHDNEVSEHQEKAKVQVLELGQDSSEDEPHTRQSKPAPTRMSKGLVAVVQTTPSITDGNEQSDSGLMDSRSQVGRQRAHSNASSSRSSSRRRSSRSANTGPRIPLEYHPNLGAAENEGRWFACSKDKFDGASKEIKSRFHHAARMLFTEEGAAPTKACTHCKDPAECLAYSAVMRETSYNVPKKCARCMVVGGFCDVGVEPETEPAPESEAVREPTQHDKGRLQVLARESPATASIAELIKQDNNARPWADKPFFTEFPEYHPDNYVNMKDRVAEIRKRPTRKQMFGKPGSRLKQPGPAVEQDISYVPPAARGTVSPEKRPRAIIDALPTDEYDWEKPATRQEFMSLQEFFGMPNNPVPIISEGQLAFRDGTLTDDGRLPRAKVLYKVGYGA